MSSNRRLIVEIGAIVLLLLIGFAFWSVSRRNHEQQLADLRTRQENAAEQIRQDSERRAEWLAQNEATAVFRAFAAGIQGSALGQQKGMLDLAKGGVLRMPYVAFVHVLTPDGKVLTSSNEKYTVAGSAGDRAAWALGATDLQTRPGDLPGTIEIAAPFQGASGRSAILWMGYKTRELLAASGGEQSGSGGEGNQR